MAKGIKRVEKPKLPSSGSAEKNAAISRIRQIGNSKGILLSNSILNELGIENEAEVVITTTKGCILIKPLNNKRKINTDLSSWEAQFKAAIKNGHKPGKDMFEGIENIFDKEEW